MLAAAVTLLLVAEFVAAVAEPPTVPAPVVPPPPLALEPAVERLLAADPLAPVPALDTAAVPVVTTAPIPVVEVLLALFGTALTAVTPVVVPPVPLTVPAVAAPPLAAPLLVFVGFHAMVAWGVDGLAWQTARLSWEGIRVSGVEEGALLGFGWDMRTDREVGFSVDLKTGAHTGGGF